MKERSAGDLLIRAHGLSKSFGAHRAVEAVSMTVAAGEVVGLVGPNGAGKTTTLRMLAGLIAPDSGDGDVAGQPLHSLRRGDPRIGYMPQKLALYGDLSVTENLRFRADVYRLPKARERVEEALDAFGLRSRARQRADRLSGGWARRLQLAASLVHAPLVVLLDEPTAGLDAASRQEVWRRIQGLARDGAGVVVNTHDLFEAERCTRILLLQAGRVVLEGDPARLTAQAAIQAGFVDRWSDDGEEIAGVLTAEPHGSRVRLVARADALPSIRRQIEGRGGAFTPDETRLSDVVLVAERGGEGAEACG